MSSLDPVAVFRTEAAECLEAIEAGLLDLTHDLDNKDLVDAVFRGLHTLKGSGAMFGFEALAAFTHHCETAFDRVRKGEVSATSELVAAVLAAQDHMRALVDQPDADPAAAGLPRVLATLQPNAVALLADAGRWIPAERGNRLISLGASEFKLAGADLAIDGALNEFARIAQLKRRSPREPDFFLIELELVSNLPLFRFARR